MSSLGQKLGRLTGFERPSSGSEPPSKTRGDAPRTDRPSLDDLRERIARIVAKQAGVPASSTPARGELPFLVEHTSSGPLYVRRVRAVPAARVGRAPLIAARDADASMLALLALDPSLQACAPAGALFVDTETTGLAGGTGTVPFLIGLAWFDPIANMFVLEQLLLRRLGEEAPMLERFAERIAEATMIVTFNGKSFDLPLLRTRFVMNRLAAPKEPPHLDLVHVARRVHRTRLKTKTLASIEHEVLGRVRVDDVAGGDIVATYAHFLRTGDDESLLGVIEHNEADVLSMVALVGLYGEPIGALHGEDLAGAARVVRRAGDLVLATSLADEALLRGGGAEARRARGEIAKAQGDRARALVEFEALAAEVDDDAARLELAKLYEHHVRSFSRALELVASGTGEDEPAIAKRSARLRRKLARQAALITVEGETKPRATSKRSARAR